MPKRSTPLTYYHELSPDLYSATSSTFIGQIYGLLGLQNVADEAEGASSGYPQLSSEYLVAKSPDFVFLADTKCCQQDAASVAARPGWSGMKAVTNGGVVATRRRHRLALGPAHRQLPAHRRSARVTGEMSYPAPASRASA